jgi:hypothetical protein
MFLDDVVVVVGIVDHDRRRGDVRNRDVRRHGVLLAHL